MGAQWKQKWRELGALKKGQLVGKLVREIVMATKQGGPDPELNARLAAAIDKARKNSVTKDAIERGIKKGSGQTDESVNYELITFEGFAPHKVPVVVECLTDNRNRTAPDIRHLFKAGQLGQPGSMSFFFEHLGVVEASHEDTSRDPEEDAIMAGAQNVEELDADEVSEGHLGATFITNPKDLAAVSTALRESGWKISASELRYLGKNPVELGDSERSEVESFLNALDDNDDVHRVYAAMK